MMIAALLEHHQMRATGMGIFWEFGLVLFYTVAAVFVGVLLGSSVQKTYGVTGMAPRKKETASHGGSCSGSGSSGSSSSKSMNDGINSYNKARVKGAVYKEVSEQSVDKYISEHEPSSSGSKGKAARSSSSSSPTGGAPRHVAVIMDGNRRFGQEYHNDPLKGHWSGGETLGTEPYPTLLSKYQITKQPTLHKRILTHSFIHTYIHTYRKVLRVVPRGGRGGADSLRFLHRELASHSSGTSKCIYMHTS